MRSVKEMMDAQQFLEKYADTPIGEIDAAKAREVLQRSGFLTKSNRISTKYSGLVIKEFKKQIKKDYKDDNC